ncbi:MAG: penicillin-binding protein 2 [Actinobacteria bacterium]|nr:penicillin-binding protein 2 [Actinomycetota bacterium]
MIKENNSIRINRKRIYLLFILFLAALALISYRLFNIQYFDASRYIGYADYQHTNEFKLYSKRGKILDINGTELAVSLLEKTVYADPKKVLDAEYEAKVISGILDMEYEDLYEKLSKKDLGFVYLKRQISSDKADEIESMALPGVYVQTEAKRYYPQKDIAAAVIGFTGTDNNGLSGIELQFEDILRGVDGKAVAEKDVFGNIIPGNIKTYIEPINGEDITLTIDSQIQFMAQKELEEVTVQYEAQKAIAVVMDPNTGEVFAMASYPGFDPNDYQDYEEELYKVMGTSFTYEPGSTFKIVNVATALESHAVGEEQAFSLPPSIKVSDRVIKEIFRTYNITYTTREIIQHSSNVGAVTVALSMGDRIFWEGIKKFGFGEPTGIELPGEENGIVLDYRTWPLSTIGALAIGQSISVTPLQLLRAVSVIANGGYLVRPTIIKNGGLLYDEGMNVDDGREQILSSETCNAVKDMMLAVVEEGTGTQAQVEGLKICGKTGTAEKANRSGVGYSEGRVITSFIGFAPYENPVLAVVVVVDEPQGSDNTIWGGTVAAPIFRNIMEFSLNRLKVFG